MTLTEYRKAVKNIKKTHPAPEGMEFPQTNFFFTAKSSKNGNLN